MTNYKLRAISKSFGKINVLNHIDLEIEDELVGIIGHSGVGKTTLLKMLAGLELPSSGELSYNNISINKSNVQFLRKNSTMIFQSPIFLRGDVLTNIAYGLRIRKVPERIIKDKIENVLEAVRLPSLSDRDTKELSGGEQQRIALARAIVLDPNVLLLDEPTSNLDPANVGIINDILREQSEERLVVIATHDLLQVSRLAERVLFLNNGVISEEGTPSGMEALVRYTENVFTGISRRVGDISILSINDVDIQFTNYIEGRVSIHIRPQDILLSKDWIETSARNQFRGSIVSIEDKKNGIIMIGVDVGVIFRVQITNTSFKKMNLFLGKELNLSFKASSVITL